MPISVRVRFEIFKRDRFMCRYCGRRSPEVVLEVDHIVARSAGGTDDELNLLTACWDCNRGKGDKPLAELLIGEDPHDRAVMLLERERQLKEYNAVLAQVNERIEEDREVLEEFWRQPLSARDKTWLWNALTRYPREAIYRAMSIAVTNHRTAGLAYVVTVLKNQHDGSSVNVAPDCLY